MEDYTLKRAEQETVITWDDQEKTAQIYTASPVTKRKLEKLCEQFPDTYKRVQLDHANDGAMYEVYKGFVRFGKPRTVSEEQKQAAKERAVKMWAGRMMK